jgi:hypothetical protein
MIDKKVDLNTYLDIREKEIIKKLDTDQRREFELLRSYEKTRALLYNNLTSKFIDSMDELRNYVEEKGVEKFYDSYNLELLKGWDIEYKNNRIKITANEFPLRVHVKTIVSEIDILNKRLSANVAAIVKTLEALPNWDSIFVGIQLYLPVKNYDIDNSYYKPIIDGIAKSGLINDDICTKLSFGCKGFYDNVNPRTIIYIFDEKCMNFSEVFNV